MSDLFTDISLLDLIVGVQLAYWSGFATGHFSVGGAS